MFVTFEGIDFCGKSTQVELLKNYWEEKNKDVILIREPGGTEISEKIRSVLLDKKNNLMFMQTELLLFSSSRAQLVREKIRPYLQKGFYIISDRFHDSSTAYQGYGRGIDVEAVKQIHKIAIDNVLPDLTFYIDIPVEEAEKRKSALKKIELDRIEVSEKDFYERVRQGYFAISETEKRFRVINGLNTIENIHKEIIKEVELYEALEHS